MNQAYIPLCIMLQAGHVVAQHAVPTTATFKVKDDTQSPVASVQIAGGFGDLSPSGARDRFEGLTDTNGVFVTCGNTVLDVGAMFKKEGYYQTIMRAPISAEEKAGLRHWDVSIPVLLKPMKNPIPMYVKENRNPYVSAYGEKGKYCLERTSGYDILKGAFTPPYGKGAVPDMVFEWRMNILVTNKTGRAIDYHSCCTVLTTNAVDGICKGVPDGDESGQVGSAFISNYTAPDRGYTNCFSFNRNVRGMKAESNDDRHYLYYFRIRTQTNELGQVTNAFYGKIYGQINGNFTYYLNPTPNDRNVEHDPKRNLFKQE